MPLFLLAVVGFAVFVFRRYEGLGTVLMLLAALLLSSILGGPVQAPELLFTVRALGLHSLTLAFLILLIGSGIRFDRPRGNRLIPLACCFVLITACPLGLVKLETLLDGTSLADAGGGGHFGTFLSGSRLGLATWFGIGSGLVWMSWPQLPGNLACLTIAAVRALWRGLIEVVKAASPLEPAGDELPYSEPS